MTRGPARPRIRSGITLIEILISIMIMGIGVISIATLFPLGLIRLRNAQRLTRGAYLVESATADLGSRNLLSQGSFWPNAFYQTTTDGTYSAFYNPLYVDTPSYGAAWGGPAGALGANRYLGATGQFIGAGLPVAYDPLWWAVTTSNGASTGIEGRFGNGTAFLRNCPVGNGVQAHADGLQRINNFTAAASAAVLSIFVSPEDMVLQDAKGQYYDQNNNLIASPSPLVPDMTTGTPVYDWRYSWLFTGMQTDPSSTAVDGAIVICENRPFGADTVRGPNGSATQISGETVVEAIWGFSSSADNSKVVNGTPSYGSPSGSRSVYLRWSNTQPDPDVRVGGWIADVTYERGQANASSHFNGLYPAQRCYWYQVAKKTVPTVDPLSFNGETNMRSMTVWTTTPLQAYSMLTFTANKAATPVHVEAALIMPSVINVYPRTVYTR